MKLFGGESTLHKYSRCEIVKHDSGLQEIIIFFNLTCYFYYFRKSCLILYFASFHKAFKVAEKFVSESNFCDLESGFGAHKSFLSNISLRVAMTFS